MDYKDIGARIRARRRAKNLTQEQLAAAAGISMPFLGHIERGSRKLSLATFVAPAKALDCSADELLGETRPRTEKERLVSILEDALAVA